MKAEQKRKRFRVAGQVQGVGFRPFVYRLATELGLGGFVRNDTQGVLIEAQGSVMQLAAFVRRLRDELPPLAVITAFTVEEVVVLPTEQSVFRIEGSQAGSAHSLLISPDMSTCADCLAEIRDPNNRRYGYAFTNCTNCGPRYSITRSMPYDRPGTSMSCFAMCPQCQAEYNDPQNRRFHAQPNACPLCGPQLWYEDKLDSGKNKQISGKCPAATNIAGERKKLNEKFLGIKALELTARQLAEGKIAAIKGLGGFHLVCNAFDAVAVAELRRRKARPHKPLALMVADVQAAERLALLGPSERILLSSPERPITLCRLRPSTELAGQLSLISPDTSYVGLMLPYTPLHHLLLEAFAARMTTVSNATGGNPVGEIAGAKLPAALVMTSGNRGGEPICLGNREALQRLSDIADCFLLHDRDILIRTDDSVVRPLPGKTDGSAMFLRRARGFAPKPLALPLLEEIGRTEKSSANKASNSLGISAEMAFEGNFDACSYASGEIDVASRLTLLAMGAELKNTICLTRGSEAFVSQHIGDLQNLESFNFQVETAAHLTALLQVSPALLVTDAHPDFAVNVPPQFAALPRQSLQHHFAHAEAVLAENSAVLNAIAAPVLVLVLDGTGFAPDSIWGGELLCIDLAAGRSLEEHSHRNGELSRYKHQAYQADQTCDLNLSQHSCKVRHWRLGSLESIALPGAEAAIREPWRIAHGLLYELGLPGEYADHNNLALSPSLLQSAGGQSVCRSAGLFPWLPEYAQAAMLLPKMLERGLNTPRTSSCGRLFDAVSALLGLCFAITYEGQAAIRLEAAQFRSGILPGQAGRSVSDFSGVPGVPASEVPDEDIYALFRNKPALFGNLACKVTAAHASEAANLCGSNADVTCKVPAAKVDAPGAKLHLNAANPWQPLLTLETRKLFKELAMLRAKGLDTQTLARAFHWYLAEGLADLALAGSRLLEHNSGYVGLSGGVLQNCSLLALLEEKLRARGLTPLTHKALPPNDGCIAYGQAAWATTLMKYR